LLTEEKPQSPANAAADDDDDDNDVGGGDALETSQLVAAPVRGRKIYCN